jgi:uncharacterized membrane protein
VILVRPLAVSAANARSAAYDIVLLAHVLSVVVGFGAVAVAGGYALSLRRSGPGSEAVRRYYRPGVNWAGRVLFLVPVFGFVLIGLSHHEWSLADGWITTGLLLWAVVAVAAELVLWPAERQLQSAVAAGTGAQAGPLCLRVAATGLGVCLLLVGATVVMVAKP